MLPRASSLAGNRHQPLHDYTDEEIAFMYLLGNKEEPANTAAVPTRDQDSIELGINMLLAEVDRRSLSGRVEELAANVNLSEKVVEAAAHPPIGMSELLGAETLNGYEAAYTAYHEARENWLAAGRTHGQGSQEAQEAYATMYAARDLTRSYNLRAIAVGRADEMVANNLTPVDLIASEFVQHDQRMVRAQEARTIRDQLEQGAELAAESDHPQALEYRVALRRAAAEADNVVIAETNRAKELLNSSDEQQRFGFDSGVRNSDEKREGLREHYAEQRDEAQANIDSLMLDLKQGVTDGIPQPELNAINEKIGSEITKRQAFDEKHEIVADLTTRPLSDAEKKAIEGLMTPTTSGAVVYDEGAEVNYFEDLQTSEQDRLRDAFVLEMDNDVSAHEEFRERARYHVNNYEIRDVYRDVADEITVHDGFVGENSRYFEEEIDDRTAEMAIEQGVDESEIDVNDVYAAIEQDFVPDVAFVEANTDDYEEQITQYTDERVDTHFEEGWNDHMQETADQEDLLYWARSQMVEVQSSDGLDITEFDEEDIASLVGAPEDAEVNVTVSRDGERISVKVSHPDWTAYDRTIKKNHDGDWIIKHDHLKKDKSVERRGAAGELLQVAIPKMLEKGFKEIEVNAAGSHRSGEDGYHGYAIWPRYGFNYPIAAMGSTIREKVKENFPDAESILDVYKTKKGRDWWWANGESMGSMKFDLTEGSRSLDQFKRYMLYLDQKTWKKFSP